MSGEAITSEQMKSIKEEFDAKIAEHDQRIRAEVLAACIEVIKRYSSRYSGMDYSNNTFCACIDLVKQVSELQPAASALEELLRPGSELAKLVLSVKSYETHEPRDGRWEPVLEKARAIVEKL